MSCRTGASNHHSRAFFSIDASFAFLTAAFIFIVFSAALACAALAAKSQSSGISSENLALRFSSYVLEQSAAGSGYSSVNEIDGGRFDSFDLAAAIGAVNASFAGIRLVDSDGAIMMPHQFGVPPPKGVYCAKRLAIMDGRAVRLEACIS